MTPYKVISYFTKNTGYAEEVLNLIDSLEKFNIPYDIEGVESLGSWALNTRYKAQFIKKKLALHERVVFLDADAVVQQRPVLFGELDCDIAVHYRKDAELLSGTMFFQRSENICTLLDLWIEENNKQPLNRTEQRNLQDLIANKAVPPLRLQKLPANYCQIFDIMKDEGDAIIEHFQASRRFRKAVGL